MPTAATKSTQRNRRGERKPVIIKQIGVEQWAGGLGHIKVMVVAGPDIGKTRWSSAFPRPLWLACEPLETVAASIVSRKINYEGGAGAPHIVEIQSSDGLFDTLDWLDQLATNTPAGKVPKYQTVILDTADGLADRLKNEWAESEGASIFAGRDAWAFLEGKFTLALERLCSLPMNVVVLVHLKDKDIEEPGPNGTTNKKTIYEIMLQGSTKDKIVNNFNLVGLMKKEFVGEREVRGISFDSSAQFPFLKDHFNLTPPDDPEIRRHLGRHFWPITLDDGTKGGSGTTDSFEETNYLALWTAVIGELDNLPESGDVEEIPVGGEPSADNVTPPGQGGPTPGAANVQPTKQAAAKKTAAPAKATTPPAKTAEPAKAASAPPPTTASPDSKETTSSTPSSPSSTASSPDQSSASSADSATPAPATDAGAAPSDGAAVDPGSGDGDGAAASDAAPVTDVPDAAVSEPEQPAPTAETSEPATEPTVEEAVANVAEALGGEVVSETAPADSPSGGADQTAHTHDEGHCPICGASMEKEQPDLVQLSRLKHRTLVLPDGRNFYDTGGCCYECYQRLNEEKASKSGLYAESA